jgi:CSLREA domain-containing protein
MWRAAPKLAAALVCFGVLSGGEATSAATFTVDSTADDSDASPGDGACVTALGECTLRAAIEEANALLGTDTIAFDIAGIGPHTIQPLALPAVTDVAIIDGTTEPDYAGTPVVEVDGTNAPGASGLHISAGSSTIRGLVINRFGHDGILLETNGGNLIEGNYIGTDVSGALAAGNGQGGVNISAASSNNTIGGSTGTTLGGPCTGACNVISGNLGKGIVITGTGTTGNSILGNFIGLDAAGTVTTGNASAGIGIFSGATGNSIGGTLPGERNVVSGNGTQGILLDGADVTGNSVQGNFIGTDPNGSFGIGNGTDGVRISASTGNTIGGAALGAGNLLAGNGSDGLEIVLSSAGNVIEGNLIGTNALGAGSLGNGSNGVFLNGCQNTTVGGAAAGAGNVIAGNGAAGVRVEGPSNRIHGNFIGTNPTGTAAVENGADGVLVTGNALQVSIGGLLLGEGNLISGNAAAGVNIDDPQNTAWAEVQGNLIGTQSDGTSPLGNASHGVVADTQGNVIGGISPAGNAGGNTIAFNTGDGVFIPSSDLNAVWGNAIFSNTELGIDLGSNGVSPNDAGDVDVGGNDLQNFPELTSAISHVGGLTISGNLGSDPNSDFDLQFFSNVGCDPSGNGEGETFLGCTCSGVGCPCRVTTDGSGNAGFSITLPVTAAAGELVTATASMGKNTSEFSPCFEVSVCGDGTRQGAEQCDDGNTDPGDCCSPTCEFEPDTTVCRPSNGPCDLEETCSGNGGSCPGDSKSTAECRISAGICDPAEFCDGLGDACPGDLKSASECRPSGGACDPAEFCDGLGDVCPGDLKSTSECRPSGGVCDPAEFCDGLSDPCPPDAKSTAVCRPAAGNCDVLEACDGVNNDCPADGFDPGLCEDGNACTTDLCPVGNCQNNVLPDGASCPDGDVCNGDETCQSGTCTSGSPPVCDDTNPCTTDTCDAIFGCDNELIQGCADSDGDLIPDDVDPCTTLIPDQTASRSRILIRNLHKPEGEQGVVVRGLFNPTDPTVQPQVRGVHFRLEDSGGVLYDINIPGGLRTPGVANSLCSPTGRDGWRIRITPTGATWNYINVSGQLPPGCEAGSARGIFRVVVKDLRATLKQAFEYKVKSIGDTFPHIPAFPVFLMQANLALGQQPAPGASSVEAIVGQCAESTFSGFPVPVLLPKPFCKQSPVSPPRRTIACKGP